VLKFKSELIVVNFQVYIFQNMKIYTHYYVVTLLQGKIHYILCLPTLKHFFTYHIQVRRSSLILLYSFTTFISTKSIIFHLIHLDLFSKHFVILKDNYTISNFQAGVVLIVLYSCSNSFLIMVEYIVVEMSNTATNIL